MGKSAQSRPLSCYFDVVVHSPGNFCGISPTFILYVSSIVNFALPIIHQVLIMKCVLQSQSVITADNLGKPAESQLSSISRQLRLETWQEKIVIFKPRWCSKYPEKATNYYKIAKNVTMDGTVIRVIWKQIWGELILSGKQLFSPRMFLREVLGYLGGSANDRQWQTHCQWVSARVLAHHNPMSVA